MEKISRLPSLSEEILTALLTEELYSRDLREKLTSSNEGCRVTAGSLYPALNVLVKQGFLNERWGDEAEETGGGRRKYYKTSGLGRQILVHIHERRNRLSNGCIPIPQLLPT